jgi:hypothetical protein
MRSHALEPRQQTSAVHFRYTTHSAPDGLAVGVAHARAPAPGESRGWRGAARVRTVHQPPSVVFELRRRDTGGLVHAYATEGAALAFVRDVIFIGGRDQAACFALEVRDELGQTRRLAEGVALVQRALEDLAE